MQALFEFTTRFFWQKQKSNDGKLSDINSSDFIPLAHQILSISISEV